MSFFVIGKFYYFHMNTGGWYYGEIVESDDTYITIKNASYGLAFNPGFANTPPIIPSPFVRFDPGLVQWWNRDVIIWAAEIPTLP